MLGEGFPYTPPEARGPAGDTAPVHYANQPNLIEEQRSGNHFPKVGEVVKRVGSTVSKWREKWQARHEKHATIHEPFPKEKGEDLFGKEVGGSLASGKPKEISDALKTFFSNDATNQGDKVERQRFLQAQMPHILERLYTEATREVAGGNSEGFQGDEALSQLFALADSCDVKIRPETFAFLQNTGISFSRKTLQNDAARAMSSKLGSATLDGLSVLKEKAIAAQLSDAEDAGLLQDTTVRTWHDFAKIMSNRGWDVIEGRITPNSHSDNDNFRRLQEIIRGSIASQVREEKGKPALVDINPEKEAFFSSEEAKRILGESFCAAVTDGSPHKIANAVHRLILNNQNQTQIRAALQDRMPDILAKLYHTVGEHMSNGISHTDLDSAPEAIKQLFLLADKLGITIQYTPTQNGREKISISNVGQSKDMQGKGEEVGLFQAQQFLNVSVIYPNMRFGLQKLVDAYRKGSSEQQSQLKPHIQKWWRYMEERGYILYDGKVSMAGEEVPLGSQGIGDILQSK